METTQQQEHAESTVINPSHYEVARLIAGGLGETGDLQQRQIRHIVWALGRKQALALAEQAVQIDANEGMMVPDGSRRRTVGGIFFYLAYTYGKPEEGKQIRKLFRPAPQTRKPSTPPFVWDDRIELIKQLLEKKGQIRTVKITLVGKLGKYAEKGSFVAAVMQSSTVPSLPKGLPAPQPTKTNYVVYIAAKQWQKVADTVNDPEDILIVEGFPQSDSRTGAISVFTTSVTTKKLQTAAKAANKEKQKAS